MQFVSPISWSDALDLIGDKSPIGAALSSAEWQDVPVALRLRAMFSANVENVRFLQRAQDALGDFLAENRVSTPNGPMLATGGRAAFIQQLREFAQAEGMGPLDPKDLRGIKDITSERRLGLIFDTLTTQAGSYAYYKQGQDADVLNEFPAMRFIRVIEVKEPRLNHAQYQGQVFLKSDPIWAQRINQDFGVPWAPFGWGCGHDTEDVDRNETEKLGLLAPGQRVEPNVKNFNHNLQASTRGLPAELIEKLQKAFGAQIRIEGESISWNTGASPQSAVRSPQSTVHSPESENQSPVSDAIVVKVTGSLKEAVNTALAAIDQVHDDGDLPELPLKSGAGHGLGVFAVGRFTNEPVYIGINPNGPHPALSAVHEIGHFLDQQAIGVKGSFATADANSVMQDVLAAAENSERIQGLRAALAKTESYFYQERLEYLLEPHEIWARAYAQYIATRSGNNTLLRDLETLTSHEANRTWTDADFEPIAEAIDAMFRILGWI